jgi:hypothetical protein
VSLARFIAAQRTGSGVPHAVACRALSVSRAWFYNWRDGDCSVRRARRAELAAAVKRVFYQSGCPRTTSHVGLRTTSGVGDSASRRCCRRELDHPSVRQCPLSSPKGDRLHDPGFGVLDEHSSFPRLA